MRRMMIGCLGGVTIDPYTYMLLHMDGADNGTTFTDSSRFGRIMSVYGNTKTSTTQSKFGGSAAYFDGSGDYLSNADADIALGAGNFTVDFWLRIAVSQSAGIFDTQIIGGSDGRANSVFLRYSSSDARLRLSHNSAYRIASSALSTNTWYHVAIVRSGSTTTMYINGTSVGTTTAITANISTASMVIGENAATSSEYLNGYVDEFRVSPGIARWTANFTAPTAPYAM